jgi:2-C-methyl-D-erythritol 2,4-cyclodiphosphate synthase
LTGIGYDTHKLAKNESFILGGIAIESEIGTIAHSDGDVLLHSIIDALLGAAGLGDIGDHFPDNDDTYKNASSIELTYKVIEMIRIKGFEIINVDATIILEKPKLKEHKLVIKKKVAEILGISYNKVNIKATTNEKMGFLGRSEGIAVLAVCEIK